MTRPSSHACDAEALRLFRDGRYVDAADRLREALRLHPDSLKLWEHLLISLTQVRAYGEYVVAYREYAALGGRHLSAKVWHAIALLHLGRFDQVMVEVGEVAEVEELPMELGLAAAMCLLPLAEDENRRTGVATLALRIARRLVQMYPDVADAHFAVGCWMGKLRGPDEESLALAAKAVDMAPEQDEYRIHYANSLYELGRRADALAEWEKMPLTKVNCAQSLSRMAGLYRQNGNHAAAAACRARLDQLNSAPTLSDSQLRQLLGEPPRE